MQTKEIQTHDALEKLAVLGNRLITARHIYQRRNRSIGRWEHVIVNGWHTAIVTNDRPKVI